MIQTYEYDVVVVDSGVDCTHPELCSAAIEGLVVGVSGIRDGCKDIFGHGTAVCGIIHKHAPNAKILMIKIINDFADGVEEDQLILILNFIYENVKCSIINLSLGLNLIQDSHQLYQICSMLKKKGITIIAAFDNSGAISYPAVFDCVYGVEACDACAKTDEIIVCNSNVVNLCAYGKAQRVLWRNSSYIISGGNSYACAHATGVILKEHMEKPQWSISDIIEKISRGQLEFTVSALSYRKPPCAQYKRVALYPFNKEMHSLVRFENALSYEIVDIYDTKYSVRVGAYTNSLLGIFNEKDHKIRNINDIEWDSFDTLVVGHTGKISDVASVHVIASEDLIKEALRKNKNVYAFDDYMDKIELEENSGCYYSPAINYKKELCSCILPFGKLYKVSTPVLGVFGTSSKQGKFTLQLILRQLFLKKGYTVAQLGSEPASYLLGMDACYHFGYGSGETANVAYSVSYLNGIMHELDLLNRDIILTGCQSNTISNEINQINDLTFPQMTFLYGTQPDGIVLCVNEFDDRQYIKRTILCLEAMISCKVIAAVLFPLSFADAMTGFYGKKRRLTTGELSFSCSSLESEINLPVYVLGDDIHMNRLVDKLIEFYT